MHMCFLSNSWRLPTNLELESSSAVAKIFGIFKSRPLLLEIVFKKNSDLYHSCERPTVSTGIGDLACQLLALHAHHLRGSEYVYPVPKL